MVTGIMQPYIFPYLGYYQLFSHCDVFVFYDDANFVNRGFINRNKILSNGIAHRFTIPVLAASQNKLISELLCGTDLRKILKSLRHSYGKAPHFEKCFPLIEGVLTDRDRNLANVASASILKVFDYLELDYNIRFSSHMDYDRAGDATSKLVGMVKGIGHSRYCNSVGGQALYDGLDFAKRGVSLEFLKMNDVKYPQNGGEFVSNLSIIDVLMWNDPRDVLKLLGEYQIVSG